MIFVLIPLKPDFNTSNVTIQQTNGQLISLSILHFNTSNVTIQRSGKNPVGQLAVNFNTSNVTIQPYLQCFHLYKIFISIHLMLLFNSAFIFSILNMYDFNTSNVTIQQTTGTQRDICRYNFNTSNVTIQPNLYCS